MWVYGEKYEKKLSQYIDANMVAKKEIQIGKRLSTTLYEAFTHFLWSSKQMRAKEVLLYLLSIYEDDPSHTHHGHCRQDTFQA